MGEKSRTEDNLFLWTKVIPIILSLMLAPLTLVMLQVEKNVFFLFFFLFCCYKDEGVKHQTLVVSQNRVKVSILKFEVVVIYNNILIFLKSILDR